METETIKKRLEKLHAESPALFGIMTAQHMVEHLILTVKISYGRIKIADFGPSEKQLAHKQTLLYTDAVFPRGIKAPGMGDEALLPLRFPDLAEAKDELLKSLKNFDLYFLENPETKTVHPRFGTLSHNEWELFHAKHFAHHLGQFGL